MKELLLQNSIMIFGMLTKNELKKYIELIFENIFQTMHVPKI